MSPEQKADMKKKFSHANQINQGEQRIYAIAWDISQHFKENWQGSKFKAQLVAPRKRIAILYKKFLDAIGMVTSEVVITSPDTREGEEEAFGETSSIEVAFWKRMMDEHGSEKRYETNLINRFKNSDKPEIMIVVDKLLTGFDEPKNTVLYLDRKLKNHSLLQAIARVNRVCDDKEFGFVVDYYGVLGALHSALDIYTDYDAEDLEGTFTDISEEVGKLPQRHSDLWDLFKGVANKKELEAYSALLRADNVRTLFYEKLTSFARLLKMALSSIEFHKNTPEKVMERYKNDLTMFLKLRNAVQERYSDTIDYRQFEGQIQKLIDTHIESGEVQIITELVNIFDKEKFAEEVEKVVGMAAKADTIASRTAKHITENMDTDPVFYKKFSQLLKETIAAYEQGRIDEIEYLRQVAEYMEKVLSHTDSDIPASIQHNNTAKAYYGLSHEVLKMVADEAAPYNVQHIALEAANAIDNIVKRTVTDNEKVVVDWQNRGNLIGKMKIEMEDFLIDEVKTKYEIPITFDNMDEIIDRCVEVAKLWFRP
jgi:type I restriction enzyme R subunit